MSTLYFKGEDVSCQPEETVLDALVRGGASIDFSCRSGVCRRCLIRRLDAPPPPTAQRGLPPHLQAAAYLLACQCRPVEDMVLAPASPEDMLTRCVVMRAVNGTDGGCELALDPCTEWPLRPGQRVELKAPSVERPVVAQVTGHDGAEGWVLTLVAPADVAEADWLAQPDTLWGQEIELRGPFPVEPAEEVTPQPPDPDLWAALGDGATVRAVLEHFYASVYADPQLRPYFARVTMDRVIGKQYAFLKQSMTGEASYIGERPRNAHHWMVIPESVFEHRQRLMHQAQRAHGLDADLIRRWNRHEEQYRPDIVKYAPWPRRMGGERVNTEAFGHIVLGEATVCDHCSQEIPAGTEVRYHLRLGQVGCHRCSPLRERRSGPT